MKARRSITMKKRLILCFGLVIAVLLLVSTAALADAITKDTLKTRAKNHQITIGEWKDFLDTPEALTLKGATSDLILGPDYELNGRTLTADPYYELPNPVSTNPKPVKVTNTNTYYVISDDVTVIKETNDNWYTGDPTTLAYDSVYYTTYPNGATFDESTRVLILETDGYAHAAFVKKESDTLLKIERKLNIARCIESGKANWQYSIPIPRISVPIGTDGYFTGGSGALTVYFDADVDDWGTDITINDLSLGVEYDDCEVKLDDSGIPISINIPIVKASEDGPYGFSVSEGLYFNVDGSGTGTTKFSMGFREGVRVQIDWYVDWHDAGWNHHDPTGEIKSTDMEGEVYLGAVFSGGFGWGDVIGIGPSFKAGMVLSAHASDAHFFPDDTDHKYWHECNPGECVCGSAFMRVGPLSVDVTAVGDVVDIPIWNATDPTDFPPFAEFYASKTFGDSGMTPCPHRGYRLNVNTQNQDKEPLKGVKVSYKPVVAHYEEVASAKTDAAGNAVLYAQAGKDYYAMASITSGVDPSIIVTEERFFQKTADVQDMNLTLQIPTKHIWFRNPSTGGTTDWPEDITYMPFYSEHVRLPSNVPLMSGWHFMGWNDKQDGTGKTYLPGQTIVTKDDVTLWAQWQKAENSWLIIYNANGATSAPGPQIVPNGVGAFLSRETPDAPTLIFKGWTTDLSKPEPEYQPGDYLAYDSNKRVVVLHAVWQMSPVRRPVYVSYDANGLQGASLPPNFWLIDAGWAQVGYAVAPLGGPRAFLGWSEKPNAVRPEYKAGKAYYFDQDTTLYAVWGVQYKVTYGAGSVWIKGSGKTQRFIANGAVKDFVELRVDNLPFNDGVTISSGSTIADISAKAMEKLSNGTHTVTFIYTDGTASANFTVQPKYPPTGDKNHPALWLILVVSGIAGIALVGKRAFTARRKKQ